MGRIKVVLVLLTILAGTMAWAGPAVPGLAARDQTARITPAGPQPSQGAGLDGAPGATVSQIYGWHTFYGSHRDNEGHAIAVDKDGNIYVAGYSAAPWLGDGGRKPLHPHSGLYDLVVLKLDSSGAYQWHTFYGSADWVEVAYGIAVDDSGNIYVTGVSTGSWLGDGDTPPLHAFSGGEEDLFVLKLDSDGAYQWHAFYGGELYADGLAVTTAEEGKAIYVSGSSSSPFQGPAGEEPLHPYTGSSSIGDVDIMVLKLDSQGTYEWHTFYGQQCGEAGQAIVVDDARDAVYVAGSSGGPWTGDEGAKPLHDHTGMTEIVVLKLSGCGAYRWHTFYGSSSPDGAWGITLDGNGDLYVTGGAYAPWLGDGGREPLHTHSGFYDLVVLKLDSSGGYLWHTFYGSADSADEGSGIATDAHGNLFVTGGSEQNWLGDGGSNPGRNNRGAGDLVVLKLRSDGTYCWHSFYGSASRDNGFGVAVDASGCPCVTGLADVTWLGDSGQEPLHPHSPGAAAANIVVLKLYPPVAVYSPIVRR
jgi:hypothetical protein